MYETSILTSREIRRENGMELPTATSRIFPIPPNVSQYLSTSPSIPDAFLDGRHGSPPSLAGNEARAAHFSAGARRPHRHPNGYPLSAIQYLIFVSYTIGSPVPEFRERAAIFGYTVHATLSHYTPQGRRAWQFRVMLKREIRMLRQATSRAWRPRRQNYQGWSSRVAPRPEGRPAPPHGFNLLERLSPPSHGFS